MIGKSLHDSIINITSVHQEIPRARAAKRRPVSKGHDPLWPSVNIDLLLASCATTSLAGRLIKRDRRWPFVAAIFASVGLVSLILVIRWQQFEPFEFRWDSHPYGATDRVASRSCACSSPPCTTACWVRC